MNTELLKRITIVPGLMSGQPTIRNMRFPVGDILEMLVSGMTNEEILEQHPILEKKIYRPLYCMLHYAQKIPLS
jgi:uncharacterized protein (DUF433 family)